MTLRVALAGPLSTRPLRPLLDRFERGSRLPHGFGETALNGLVQGFLERGVELVVVTLSADVDHEFLGSGPGIRLCVGPYRARHRARDAFRVEREYISAILQREQPEIVHAHWTYEFALGGLASGRPTVTTIRDWAPAILRYHLHPYRAVRLAMQAETLRRGRHFTAVSPYIQQRVRRWTGRTPVVVPNGLIDQSFDGAPRRLEAERPVLVAANVDFGRRKNVHTLLRALAIVRRSLPSCTLTLLGSHYGPGGPAHDWARSRGLDKNVEFRGPVSKAEVADVFRGAHLLVHPSLEESFGNVLVEAMGQGLPVLGGANSGAVPWVLDGGRAGVLTDVRSPERLAETIVAAVSDPHRWAEWSRRGYEHAWRNFRQQVVLDRYWDLYEAVAQERTWTLS